MVRITQLEWLKHDEQFDCPCCGSLIRKGNGRIVDQPCKHFLFFWDGKVGGLEDSNIMFDAAMEGDDQPDDCSVESLIRVTNELELTHCSDVADHQDLRNERFDIWQIDFHDHADGPIERTDLLAFDSYGS